LGKYISIRESPVFDDKGSLEMVIHVVRDITKRKRAEEKLRKYAEELKKSNEFKEIFLDIFRHDLLNPVCIIKGMAKVALNERSEEDLKHEIKTIIKNAEILLKLFQLLHTDVLYMVHQFFFFVHDELLQRNYKQVQLNQYHNLAHFLLLC